MSNFVIEADGLGKAYSAQPSSWKRLKSLFAGGLDTPDQWALKDVSFSLRRGQCLGVIGDNGAGKSTLLKLIAGTLRPSAGSLSRIGRATAILELGAGFHPEFTGRQNLYFGGALIGIPEEQMRNLESGIIDFSELAESIDRPVKTYSSGMSVRLAFALVTAVEPEVLIIDEALAVGDQHFQRKSLERIEAFRKNGCTIFFCTHSLYHVRQLCDVALWLDKGKTRALGPTENVLAAYETHVRNLNAAGREPEQHPYQDSALAPPETSGGLARLLSVEVAGLAEGTPPLLEAKDLTITVTACVPNGDRPHLAVMLERADKICVTAAGTHNDDTNPVLIGPDQWRATITYPNLPLYSGEYVVSAFLFDNTGTLVYEQWLDCQRFMFIFPTREIGVVRLPHVWS